VGPAAGSAADSPAAVDKGYIDAGSSVGCCSTRPLLRLKAQLLLTCVTSCGHATIPS
jgi:hypothetical protein